MNFLEQGEELQNLLCEAEYIPEQQRIVLVPVTDFRLKARPYFNKNYINTNIGGSEASDFLFYLSISSNHLNIILRHEKVLCNCRASTMLNSWEKRDSYCLKRTVDVIAIFLRRNVSTVYGLLDFCLCNLEDFRRAVGENCVWGPEVKIRSCKILRERGRSEKGRERENFLRYKE